MKRQTIEKFNQYLEYLSTSLKLDHKGNLKSVSLNDELEKQFFHRLQENSFFGLINIIKSTNSEGNTLGLQLPIPSTADTAGGIAREAGNGYISPFQSFKCQQINIDTAVSYAKLDHLADYLDKDFNQMLERYLDKQILLALLMVGWNGERSQKTSDPQTYQLAQDVAKGWITKIKENRPNQVITGASVGNEQTYPNLNKLVKSGLEKMGNPYRAGELVAICGREIITNQIRFCYADLVGEYQPLITMSLKSIGGLKTISMPYFPADSILITRLDNLSLYVQTGTIRKSLLDNPRLDRWEQYQSMNLDFIIEDYNCVALIENISRED